MPSDLTTYDYDVIDECNRIIRQKVESLHGRADSFSDESVNLVQSFWGGATAETYATQAKDIVTDLLSLTGTLSQIGGRVSASADRMIEADMKGSKQFDAV